MRGTICLNADIGELPGMDGRALDRAILDIVSRCNIACGGHAGDTDSMIATVKAAKARKVLIGAHPSYPDRKNFGRASVRMSREALESSLLMQVRTLMRIAQLDNAQLTHLKPHGALYNDAATAPDLAGLIGGATRQLGILALMGPPGSALQSAADQYGLEFIAEGFADRRYNPDGSLVSRNTSGAVLDHVDDITEQALQLVRCESLKAIDGTSIDMKVDSICLHSDTSDAIKAALGLREALRSNGIRIEAAAA